MLQGRTEGYLFNTWQSNSEKKQIATSYNFTSNTSQYFSLNLKKKMNLAPDDAMKKKQGNIGDF